MVRRVVEESGVSRATLARDAEVSYHAIHAWITGRRTPEPESLARLAAGLRRRAGRLEELAAELERAAGE